MRRTEGVVHVEVGLAGELAGEFPIVARLLRVEAGVLEHANPLVREPLAQRVPHRSHRERHVRPFGPAEVRADDHLGRVALEEQLEGRQRGPDPRVVGDLAILERDVQVGADEHALPGDLRVATDRGFRT